MGLLRNVTSATLICVAVAPLAAAQDHPAARPSVPADQDPAPSHCLPYQQFSAAVRELAAGAAAVTAESLAKTHGGREVLLLTITPAGDLPGPNRRGILIVGGVDAEYPATSRIALEVAKGLANGKQTASGPDGATLESQNPASPQTARPSGENGANTPTGASECIFYVIPRLNPDGIQRYFDAVRAENPLNARSVDDDRDEQTDEDGPNDLNGDGLITLMRVPDPQGEWMIDPHEPRLLKNADPAKGERGVYKLMLEGVDDDHDGETNEDGPGGVDLDRNWPHLYEAGQAAAGRYQLSEPETRALAEFVFSHPNIAAAIVYGGNDSIVQIPSANEARARGPDGRSYRTIHPDDIPVFQHLSEIYRENTGSKEAGGSRPEGALYSWLYAQRGIPTFAVNLCWPPEAKDEAPSSQPQSSRAEARAAASSDDGDDARASADDDATEGSSAERPPQRGRRGGGRRGGAARGRGGAGGEAGGDSPVSNGLAARIESSEKNRRWLKYSDTHPDLKGFVDWVDIEHPEFGRVQVGGFAPYFTSAPPAEELESIVDAQAAFVGKLRTLLPVPRFTAPEVKKLSGELWEIKVGLMNEGMLPTHLAMARHIEFPGFAVRPDVEGERLVGGARQVFAPGLAGSGGTQQWRWLLRGDAGSMVEFTAYSPGFGVMKLAVRLTSPQPADPPPPRGTDPRP